MTSALTRGLAGLLDAPPGGGILAVPEASPRGGTVYQGTPGSTGTAVIHAPLTATFQASQARAVAVLAEIAALGGTMGPAVAGCDGLNTQMFDGGCTPELVRSKIFLVDKYDRARSELNRLLVAPTEIEPAVRQAYVWAVGAWVLVAYEAAALRRVWAKPFSDVVAVPAPLLIQGAAGTPGRYVAPAASAARHANADEYSAAIWATDPGAGLNWPFVVASSVSAPVDVTMETNCNVQATAAGGARRSRCTAIVGLPSGRTMVSHAQQWAQYIARRDIWAVLQENLHAYFDYLKPYADRGVVNLTPAQIVAAQNENARRPLTVLNAGGAVLGLTGPIGAVVGAIIQVVAAVLPMAVGTYSCPIPVFTRSLSDPSCSTTTAGGAQQGADSAVRLATGAEIAQRAAEEAERERRQKEAGDAERAALMKKLVALGAGVAGGLLIGKALVSWLR